MKATKEARKLKSRSKTVRKGKSKHGVQEREVNDSGQEREVNNGGQEER